MFYFFYNNESPDTPNLSHFLPVSDIESYFILRLVS